MAFKACGRTTVCKVAQPEPWTSSVQGGTAGTVDLSAGTVDHSCCRPSQLQGAGRHIDVPSKGPYPEV